MTVDPVIADASRRGVLTVWGEQDRPMVLAPTQQLALHWLTVNDEFLSKGQGSYKPMIATPHSIDRLRGWRGMLVVVRPERMHLDVRWFDALDMASHIPGISIWTETLP